MKDLTIREIIKMLQEEGHHIEYYERPDGGVLIRSIDGNHFSGASGNQLARSMVGATLSESRSSQLTRITKARELSDKELNKLLKQVQKEWAKTFGTKKEREAKGKASPGSITSKKVRKIAEEQGKTKAEEYLKEHLKYAQGYAYEDNVRWLIKEIDRTHRMVRKINGADELAIISIYVENNIDEFKEEWIKHSYEVLYDIQKEHKLRLLTPNGLKEYCRRLKSIINMG